MIRSPDPAPRIRWWPAAAIVALAAALLAWIWTSDLGQTQDNVVRTFPVLFLAALGLFAWFVLLSRLPWRVRRTGLVAGLAAGALGAALFEIEGVSGNLVPIVGFRWGGERSFVEPPSAAPAPVEAGPDDYPQFYGPGRLATLAGPALARDWDAEPPRELWRRAVGEGWSSFAIVGQAAVTQEQRGEEHLVVRYDLRTGRPVWQHAERSSFVTTMGGSGPRATPTIADGRVYALGATGILTCLDLESGARRWSRNVLEDHGGEVPEWGMASSPLAIDGRVVVQLGERGRGLAAYDASTGEPAWHSDHDSGSYSSPIALDVAGREQIVVVNARSVTGHDPATGALLWSHAWADPGQRVTLPLRIDDERLLVSAGYGVGSRLLRVTPRGEAYDVELLWQSPRLKSKFAPLVLHRETVYGLDDGVLVALDPASGERRWKAGRYGHGQLVLVGDLLVIQAEDGTLALVEAAPEEHRELSRIPALAGKTWNPPALSGRLLLVRNDREAACFELPVR